MPTTPFAYDIASRTPQGSPSGQGLNIGALDGATAGLNGLGRGLQALGQGIGQASDHMQAMGKRQAAWENETAVNAAMLKLHQTYRTLGQGNPDDESDTGFFGTQGLTAAHVLPQASQQVQHAREEIIGTLTSPAQKEAFERQSGLVMEAQLNAMGSHALQQRVGYQKQITQATIAQHTDFAAAHPDNPLMIRQALVNARSTMATQLRAQGLEPGNPLYDQQMLGVNDQVLLGAALARLKTGDAIGAQTFLEQNRANMSGTGYATAVASFRPHVVKEHAELLANRYLTPTGQTVLAPANATSEAAWKSIVNIESGGRHFDRQGQPLTSGVGGEDAPLGVAQIRPSTAQEMAQKHGIAWDPARLRSDPAYNGALGKLYYEEMCARYGGNPQLGAMAYNAGPGKVDQWITRFGNPLTGQTSMENFISSCPVKETRDYANNVGAALGGKAAALGETAFQEPDVQGAIRNVLDNPNLDPDTQQATISLIVQRGNQFHAANASARAQLTTDMQALESGYAHGDDTAAVPEDRIRQLYPAPQADRLVQSLNLQRTGATAMTRVMDAPADQLGTILHDWTDPDGAVAQHNKIRPHAPGTTLAANGESVEDQQARLHVASLVQTQMAARNRALTSDPAAYVMSRPALQPLIAAAQNGEDGARDRLVQESLAQQRLLGVAQPRIMDSSAVRRVANAWGQMDPAKDDPLVLFHQLETNWGPEHWPQVAGELIRYGKFPPLFEAIAAADTPAQAGFRHDMVAASRLSPDDLKKTAGTEGSLLTTHSNDLIANALAPFKATTELQAGGPAVYTRFYNTATTMAQYALATGKAHSAEEAASWATNGLLNAKYDFAGTIRAPKGLLPAVKQAGQTWRYGLKAEELAPLPTRMFGTTEEAQAHLLKAIHTSGQLVPNHDESGYNLVVPTTTPGVNYVIKGTNGQPLTLPLKDIASGKWAALPWAQRAKHWIGSTFSTTPTENEVAQKSPETVSAGLTGTP